MTKKKNDHKQKASETQEIEQVRTTGARRSEPFTEEHIRVPLIEEQLTVDRQWVQAGEVQLRKHIETRTESIPVELGFEQVQVDRVAVNRVLEENESAAPRQEGDTLIIPVVQEELVVLKRRVVREELRVTKRRETREQVVSDTVRSEQISVETAGQLDYLNNSGDSQQAR